MLFRSLAVLVLMLMLGRVARMRQPDRAAALGLVACAAAIAFVEHNGWAAWWTAGLGAAITWMREATRMREAATSRTDTRREMDGPA